LKKKPTKIINFLHKNSRPSLYKIGYYIFLITV